LTSHNTDGGRLDANHEAKTQNPNPKLLINLFPSHTKKTGAIYVVDELDYEQKQNYELVLRATDSISGVSADVPVSVQVKDVNDCPPEIELDSYNITVSESKAFGTQILKVVAKDNDTGEWKPIPDTGNFAKALRFGKTPIQIYIIYANRFRFIIYQHRGLLLK
jgi:Cadherin domain